MADFENLSGRLLLVDDDEDNTYPLAVLGRKLGLEVVENTSGDEAFATLSSAKFGCVISDWNMNNGDGLELLQKVQEHELVNAFIFLSGRTEALIEQLKQQCIARDTVTIWTKPVAMQTVRQQLVATFAGAGE